MHSYVIESIALSRLEELRREADQARLERLAKKNAPTSPRARREPLTHAVWHGCTPATHQWSS
jgi:hypothetical protein